MVPYKGIDMYVCLCVCVYGKQKYPATETAVSCEFILSQQTLTLWKGECVSVSDTACS